jgi:menaquinone-specific isochorismate synthase
MALADRLDEIVAVTRPLSSTPDLIALGAGPGGVLWASEDVSLAGQGVALRLAYRAESAPEISRALETIEVRDELAIPGSGPVAFGALPFDPHLPGELIVPRRVVGRRGDQWWETVIGPRHAGGDDDESRSWAGDLPAAPGRAGKLSPDQFSLTPSMPHAEWMQVVAETVERIRGGELAKVVLARRVDVVANRPFVVPEVVARLAALYPACMIFHVDGFIGASPELLVRREGARFASHPLAGTVARSGDRPADEALVAGLLASTKDRWEHRIVIDHLAQVLASWCETLDVPDSPAVLGLRNVSHLATRVEGRLARRDGTLPSALDLVAAIHPTAAVGGYPTGDALSYLEKVEGFDRGRYAGPVGWVDARGDGAWALGIRSACLDGAEASMYAGVGVVSESDPAAELAETQLKLQALLAALVRP